MSDAHPISVMKSPERWSAYYKAVAGRPPRETLLKALALFDAELFDAEPLDAEPGLSPRFAVDLGCGDGRDTAELLRRGWRVLGIDGQDEAIAHLLNRPDLDKTHLQTQIARFESLTLPSEVDLINASFSLPFCSPQDFPNLWKTITTSLRTGGRFCGQWFGDRDSWALSPTITSHSRSQAEALLANFQVEFFEEEEHPGKTALGEDKYWHLFHIVARRDQ